MDTGFQRPLVRGIEDRITRPPELIQIVVGPRQVGKTTAAHQVAERWAGPTRYAAADLPLPAPNGSRPTGSSRARTCDRPRRAHRLS